MAGVVHGVSAGVGVARLYKVADCLLQASLGAALRGCGGRSTGGLGVSPTPISGSGGGREIVSNVLR